MPHFSATTCKKGGLIWYNNFVVMTLKVNIDKRPILQPSVIKSFCVCGQSTTGKKYYKNGSTCNFAFEAISWKLMNENTSHFCQWYVNNVTIRYVNEGTLFKALLHSTKLCVVFRAHFFWDTQ